MLYTYSFQNKKRDLSDILSTVVKDEPRFISNFRPVEEAQQQKHEWLEDQIAGRSVTATAVASGVVTASAADAAKVRIGTLLVIRNDSALFRVTAVTDTTFTVALVAANGSAKSTPAKDDVLNIVSTPVAEGSNPGDGDETGITGGVNYNCCQIFRKDIILSGSALAINVFGNADNQLNRQTAFALGELARDLNRVALFGRRVEATASARGEAGGLYFFGTQAGGLAIDGSSARLDSATINDAAQAVMGAG
ncbi:MAG: DUF5309 family protein, partial [Victivallis vadensis]